jgi:hypothetical protein
VSCAACLVFSPVVCCAACLVFECFKTCDTTNNRRECNPPIQIRMLIEGTYTSNNRRQQFPRPVILTSYDDHIDRNMQWRTFKVNNS